MRGEFDPNLVGLQIFWEEGNEIEYFGPAVLSGNGSCTAATYKLKGRPSSYLYPVEINRKSPKRLVLTYRKNPSNWPRGWELCKGNVIIDFLDGHSQVPETISFWDQESNDTEVLEKDVDWVYQASPAPSQLEFKARGKINVSKFDRPNQQALRNILLSAHGQCQISGTRCPAALEACHIVPVANGGDDSASNALLLRRDLHALFDGGHLRFRLAGDSWVIEIDSSLSDLCYLELKDKPLMRRDLPCHRYLEARNGLEGAG